MYKACGFKTEANKPKCQKPALYRLASCKIVEERKWTPGQCGNEHKIHTTANWFQFFGWFKGQVWLAYQQVGHMLLSPSNHWPPLFIPTNPNMGSLNFKTNRHLKVALIVKPTSSQQNRYLQKKKKKSECIKQQQRVIILILLLYSLSWPFVTFG